jgi:enamine deaminase RidA (YjgF/YER057c/UK114 family)
VRVGNLVFMSGTEAMDFKDGKVYVAEDMSEQIKTVVRKMDETLKEIGLSLDAMVKHIIFMKKGSANPIDVISQFHAACYKYAPGLRERPSTGTIVVIESLVTPAFKIEVEAVAAYPDK